MNKVIVRAVLLAGSVLASSTAAHASDGGMYIGAFGGIGSTANQSVEQLGTAHKGFAHEEEYYTYDLQVDVDGKNKSKSSSIFGGQIGYEFNSSSSLKPALEVEGLYLSANQRSNLVNLEDDGVTNVKVSSPEHMTPSVVTDPHDLEMVTEHVMDTPLSAGNHKFANKAKMKVALFTLNGVLTYDTGSKLKPYVGGGLGLAVVNMRNADSQQTGPGGIETANGTSEPVNHFNSRTHDNDVALAFQAKAGVRVQLSKRVSLFAEYRFIHLASTSHTFGSTVYASHAPTDNWVVKNGSMNLHNGLVGVRFGF
jgi:opacity protein-like surface antigen